MAVAVVPGLGVGAIAAVLLSQSLRSMLFAISPQDPYVLAAAALMISVVALAGAYIPTRRLSRIDPLEAVTSEY
jgi:ABC-type antimicrobial peptide transport system permease subunit